MISPAATAGADIADLSAARLARSLRTMEHHLDAAFAAGGEVAIALVGVRQSRNLSAVVGHQAFGAFGRASLSLTEARDHAVAGHRLLEALAGKLGIDISAFGDERKDQGDSLPTGG